MQPPRPSAELVTGAGARPAPAAVGQLPEVFCMVSRVCALPVFEQLLGEVYRRRHALNSVSLARPLAAGPTLAEPQPQLCSTVPSELSSVSAFSMYLFNYYIIQNVPEQCTFLVCSSMFLFEKMY